MSATNPLPNVPTGPRASRNNRNRNARRRNVPLPRRINAPVNPQPVQAGQARPLAPAGNGTVQTVRFNRRPADRSQQIMKRVQGHGSWYIHGINEGSRYYGRTNGDDVPRSNHESPQNVDLLLMVKNISNLNQDQLLARVQQEITNLQEHSYDYDQINDIWTRLHANPSGRGFVQDFDNIIAVLRDYDTEYRINDQSTAAANLFRRVIIDKGGDPTQLSNIGIEEEILRYISKWFLTRLRFMHQYLVRDNAFRGNRTRPWEQSTGRLMINELNMRLHGPNFEEDLRMVEWFTEWSSLFNRFEPEGARQQPRLNDRTAIFYFENTYLITHKVASLMLSKSDEFSEDIDVISSWIGYKAQYDSIWPSRRQRMWNIQRDHYKPYVDLLSACVQDWDGDDDWSNFPHARYDSQVVPARQTFVSLMDTQMPTIRSGIGRWCRTAPPPPGANTGLGTAGIAPDSDIKWGEGWYCVDHRPKNECENCGQDFRCAMCSNPHTCFNCKTPYNCRTCKKLSYMPAADGSTWAYQVATANLLPGLVPDGKRETPMRYIVPLNQSPNPPQQPSGAPSPPPPPGGFGGAEGKAEDQPVGAYISPPTDEETAVSGNTWGDDHSDVEMTQDPQSGQPSNTDDGIFNLSNLDTTLPPPPSQTFIPAYQNPAMNMFGPGGSYTPPPYGPPVYGHQQWGYPNAMNNFGQAYPGGPHGYMYQQGPPPGAPPHGYN